MPCHAMPCHAMPCPFCDASRRIPPFWTPIYSSLAYGLQTIFDRVGGSVNVAVCETIRTSSSELRLPMRPHPRTASRRSHRHPSLAAARVERNISIRGGSVTPFFIRGNSNSNNNSNKNRPAQERGRGHMLPGMLPSPHKAQEQEATRSPQRHRRLGLSMHGAMTPREKSAALVIVHLGVWR